MSSKIPFRTMVAFPAQCSPLLHNFRLSCTMFTFPVRSQKPCQEALTGAMPYKGVLGRGKLNVVASPRKCRKKVNIFSDLSSHAGAMQAMQAHLNKCPVVLLIEYKK